MPAEVNNRWRLAKFSQILAAVDLEKSRNYKLTLVFLSFYNTFNYFP